MTEKQGEKRREIALVLMTFDPSKERKIIDAIDALPFVIEAHFLYGPYDGYVKIEAESSHVFQDFVAEIRRIDGINSTMTCIIADNR